MDGTRRTSAIMFTDMVGFTAAAQADEATALELLREQEAIVRPILAAEQGREVKSTGDGFLVEFDSPLRAVQCAIDIHRRLHERNLERSGPPISLRIGVHVGSIEARGGDIFGDAVNIAARVEPHARPGGICITDPVYSQIRDRLPNQIEKLAPKKLKNVRYPMELYRVALPWEAPGAPSGDASRTRLAVLPLANISPDPHDEYLADGLTEELIGALSRIRELRVIARTSVQQYKGAAKPVTEIGAELDVGSILEGSVRKAGPRVRISLKLVDSATQEPIWSATFDRDLTDVFAVQTEIAEQTAGSLRLQLLDPDRESIRRTSTSNPTAYNLYLKGIHAARQATYEGYAEAVRSLEAAIREDPEYSPPYSYLANLYLLLGGETLPTAAAFSRARELVGRALTLDPNSSEAHTARGNLALQQQQDWETSEREFKWAIAINPSNANAHFWYAMLLVALQRYGDAADQLRTTLELDPLWSLPTMWMTYVLVGLGELDAALALTEEERDRHPDDPGLHVDLATIYLRAGRADEARAEATRAAGELSDSDRMNRAVVWARLGEPAEARAMLAEFTTTPRPFGNLTRIAALRFASGEAEAAYDALERDLTEGSRTLWFDYQLLAFDPVRSDPRFRALLARLGLPTGAAPPRAGP